MCVCVGRCSGAAEQLRKFGFTQGVGGGEGVLTVVSELLGNGVPITRDYIALACGVMEFNNLNNYGSYQDSGINFISEAWMDLSHQVFCDSFLSSKGKHLVVTPLPLLFLPQLLP